MDGTRTTIDWTACGRVGSLALARMRRLPPMAVALADQALVSGANFLVVVAVARSASMAEFGTFSLAFAVLLFLLSLVYALVNLPLSVLLPERDGPEVNAYLARLERVHRAMVPILFVIALPCLGLVATWPLVLATAVATATRMGAEYHRRIAYSLHDSSRALAIDVGAHGCLALAAVGVLIAHPRLHAWHAMAVVAATGVLGWLVGLAANRRVIRSAAPEATIAVARRHWDFGKWNLGATVAMWSASQLYPFLVAGMLGVEEVALLNGCVRIMGVANVLIQGIDSFATPRLRALALEGDRARYRRFLNRVFGIGSLVMVVVLGVVIIAPERVLESTLGHDYRHGAFAMRIIALSVSFNFVARVAGMGLNALKEARPGFWGQLACAVATLLAGPWIIRAYGLSGACVALLANAAINALILAMSYRGVSRARLAEARA